ncbi:Uncharacterized membrane-anchored protein YjiN, DUF445 family [Geodermatophilus dictyosporus]|uniref:Uncharacterized membrane-anchored protein YjiN, DUF445 family n=1 Tax=Geodermatophilus dictyosporus TaxID=1523247 RepID=A0A1I5NCV7_9ACTN|nr:DUF445 domain-containing protein [Geodermatophilus dictyosporus]SFP19216.1 Uncharacterized membrane-anchored protein YjiN, DUF445 family [Geodermatophilus dictyosporus]
MSSSPSVPLASSLDDPERAEGLRRMKRLATGLFLLAAAVFLVCVLVGEDAGAWVGYVRATAEASMVGALADWFAVTALFRHPLRIPIPHTAIIPRKKDQIGASLGTFVQENFLTRGVVEDKLATVDVPGRLGGFLAAPGRAERLAADAAVALTGVTDLLRDDDVQDAVAGLVDRKLHETPAAPVLARVLELVVDGDRHQEVLSAALRYLARFLEDNRVVFRAQLGDASPAWVPDWVDDRVFDRVFAGVQTFLDEVGADRHHELRRVYDARLRVYVHALRTDPDTAARVEAFKKELLEHPAVRTWSSSLWTSAKTAFLAAAADPDSELRARVAGLVRDAARLLQTDPRVRERVQRQSVRVAGYLVDRFAGELADVVGATVARWDTEETSRRIELQVGRDLQFIRINGTVVGGLAGLVIYTVAQLLG